MAWTTPRTWVTGELVTAAQLNTDIRDNIAFLGSWETDQEAADVTGFTNTSFADLDALTTATFSNPVIVSVTTDTEALVIVSVSRIQQATSGTCFVSYRISGATTRASNDSLGVRSSSTATGSGTYIHVATGLTAGVNTFELQARTTANSANLSYPSLIVMPKS